jgi:Resolvase, N terminal domain
MKTREVAFYARVSSEQQTTAQTILSQVAALGQRILEDGLVLLPEHEFLDEGYSGATLLHPALERLRDLIVTGLLDCVYVRSPDRLARPYAYPVLLVDEWQRAGVEVIFLSIEPWGRVPKMISCYRGRACWPNTNGPRFWSGAGAANVMRPKPVRPVSCRALPMVIAM